MLSTYRVLDLSDDRGQTGGVASVTGCRPAGSTQA